MVIVQIVSALDGSRTPHDGRYVVAWDPHSWEGVPLLTSTEYPDEARRFRDAAAVYTQYRTASRIQPIRRDGEPNRPLNALHIEIIDADASLRRRQDRHGVAPAVPDRAR